MMRSCVCARAWGDAQRKSTEGGHLVLRGRDDKDVRVDEIHVLNAADDGEGEER